MGLLITACTSRKRVSPPADLRARSLPSARPNDLVSEWVGRLNNAKERVTARELYAGRGFQEALAAAALLGGEIAIVSAGLGLVAGTCPVPAYDLSVVQGLSDSVRAKLTEPASAGDWWRALNAASPFSCGLDVLAPTSGPLLVALSENYLAMISADLEALDPHILRRVRIVTRTPESRVPKALKPWLLPYDDRLDGPDSLLRGTRGDFAQRAARHFAEIVFPSAPDGSVRDHSDGVSEALEGWRYPPSFERTRLDDVGVKDLIRTHWEEVDGQSSRLLRLLRDDLNIACEQGRFADLARQVREERTSFA